MFNTDVPAFGIQNYKLSIAIDQFAYIFVRNSNGNWIENSNSPVQLLLFLCHRSLVILFNLASEGALLRYLCWFAGRLLDREFFLIRNIQSVRKFCDMFE